ncbi:MAG: hypothetical protein IKL53_11230 [Lachnospiraceae bacterium]|nr:hypothetical protein [Lachnospiraceae bacterium]
MMYAVIGNHTFIARFSEMHDGKVELYSPYKVKGFDTITSINYALKGFFYKKSYRKLVSKDELDRLYSYRFEGRHCGQVFPFVAMGKVAQDEDYRRDTIFDSHIQEGMKVILMCTVDDVTCDMGFTEESLGVMTKVVRVGDLNEIYLIVHDYKTGDEERRVIGAENLAWYMERPFRLGY